METGIIYKFTNSINSKIYIGQTINPKRRFAEHIKGRPNKYSIIDLALSKHGIETFEYSEIANVEAPTKSLVKEYLNILEQVFIEQCDCISPKGYNLTSGGGQNTFYSNETRKKISDANKARDNKAVTEKQLATKRANGTLSLKTKGSSVMTEELKLSKACKGKIWINNGEISRMIMPSEPIPEGFKRGRLKFKQIDKEV